jgi:hypothetical protein
MAQPCWLGKPMDPSAAPLRVATKFSFRIPATGRLLPAGTFQAGHPSFTSQQLADQTLPAPSATASRPPARGASPRVSRASRNSPAGHRRFHNVWCGQTIIHANPRHRAFFPTQQTASIVPSHITPAPVLACRPHHLTGRRLSLTSRKESFSTR